MVIFQFVMYTFTNGFGICIQAGYISPLYAYILSIVCIGICTKKGHTVWGYSLKHSPETGLIYGRYLQSEISPFMALIQVREILSFTQMYGIFTYNIFFRGVHTLSIHNI